MRISDDVILSRMMNIADRHKLCYNALNSRNWYLRRLRTYEGVVLKTPFPAHFWILIKARILTELNVKIYVNIFGFPRNYSVKNWYFLLLLTLFLT